MWPFRRNDAVMPDDESVVPADEPIKERTDWTWSDTVTLDGNRLLLQMFRPGEPGRRHVMTSIHASYTTPVIGFMTLQEGMKVKGRWYVHGFRDICGSIVLPEGADLRITMNTSYHSTNGQITPALTVIGYTEDL